MDKFIIFYEAYDNNGKLLFKSNTISNIDISAYKNDDDILESFNNLAFSEAQGVNLLVDIVVLTSCTKL